MFLSFSICHKHQRTTCAIQKQFVTNHNKAPEMNFFDSSGRGHIQLIVGCMFSGKTSELLRRARIYQIAGKSTILVKYKKDTRYSVDSVSTHDRLETKAIVAETLGEVYETIKSYDVILVDEGQFVPDIDTIAEQLANENKVVIIAALDGTFQQKPFGRIPYLIPKAEQYDKLHAVCKKCFNIASFSFRIAPSQEEVMIGSSEYLPLCRHCYLQSSK